MKGFTLGLALKQRQNATWKLVIDATLDFSRVGGGGGKLQYTCFPGDRRQVFIVHNRERRKKIKIKNDQNHTQRTPLVMSLRLWAGLDKFKDT